MKDEQLYRRSFQGKAIRCLGPNEVEEMISEVHSTDFGSHLGGRRLFERLISMDYFCHQWKMMLWSLLKVVRHVKE